MDAWVREILRCPACGGTLADADASLRCENAACGLVYRTEDGIPVLLVDEATRPDAAPAAGEPAPDQQTAGPAGQTDGQAGQAAGEPDPS